MSSYKTIPALAAYIDRIGAEELNFRRFMVRDYKGDHYYVERCVIKLGPDGSVTVSNKEYAPTKEEEDAIKSAVVREKFPQCVLATAANLEALRADCPESSILYEFWDRGQDGIVMVQERAEIKGRKAYIPWSFWSDGQWRRMEPDRVLPFWKPRKKTASTRIMIHEGAKTAEFVQDLITNPDRVQELDKHPWKDDLIRYEHWGMIGGALAPHRSDYAEITREKPVEVVYVCDNDKPGKNALKEVARCYRHGLKGIMFDERWPLSWDMADPMPDSLYTLAGRWIGPDLRKLTQPATWATEQIMGPNGRPITVLRSEFADEWYHSVVPEVYVHRDWPSYVSTAQEFNNRVRPFSDVEETSRLIKMDAAAKSAVLRYNPGAKSGIYTDDNNGNRYINTHSPAAIKAVSGDPGPWLEFMERLIPHEKDRHEVLRWCATLIGRPEIKMLYGMLLISETQGVGKGTLGEKILAPLVGEDNVSYPSESEIVESSYNYWAAHKRLAVVHEIYAGHSAKAYNKLKSIVTDKYITVSKKYQANYEIENWIHVLACSNSKRAIQISMDDRRWLVPQVTEERQPADFWKRFNRWLNEEAGLGIILHWAREFARTNTVMKGDSAPWSSTKKEIVEEGYSPGMALVSDFLDRVREEMPDQPVVVLDVDLVKLIRDQLYEGRHNDRLERPLTIRKLAKSKGWFIGGHRVQSKDWGTRGSHARIITSAASVAHKAPADLVAEFRPLDVNAFAQKWIQL